MQSIVWITVLSIILSAFAGCAAQKPTVVSQQRSPQQAIIGDYCHKKLQPVRSTDPARPTPFGAGDFIDYYGPCDGPSAAEQAEKERRFEQFRFGRDYMDEG
jgi:hypothetical protein